MKNIARIATTAAAVLMLSACGSSDKTDGKAEQDNVEMPAEESVSGLPDDASPAADASAAAPADGTAKAVDSAASAAEKKM